MDGAPRNSTARAAIPVCARARGFTSGCVLSKPALGQLADIGRLAVRTGAEVVNFLGFNPFNDQATGKRSVKNVPRYAELREPLAEALDLLADAGVEANVRYPTVLRGGLSAPQLDLQFPPDPVRFARERLRQLVLDRPAGAADA
jgi:hypothetical protein